MSDSAAHQALTALKLRLNSSTELNKTLSKQFENLASKLEEVADCTDRIVHAINTHNCDGVSLEVSRGEIEEAEDITLTGELLVQLARIQEQRAKHFRQLAYRQRELISARLRGSIVMTQQDMELQLHTLSKAQDDLRERDKTLWKLSQKTAVDPIRVQAAKRALEESKRHEKEVRKIAIDGAAALERHRISMLNDLKGLKLHAADDEERIEDHCAQLRRDIAGED
ncbi:MAG: hypothetical protein MHM6MM_000564 [Cercozoa sp. M6MM]